MVKTKVNPKSLENLKNGKDTQFRAGDKQVILAQKAGEKSGEVRKENKLFKGLLDDFLKNPEKDEERIKTALEDANIHGAKKEEVTNAVIMTASIIKKAKDGDLKAVEFIRDTIGEKPTDKVENTGNPTTVINQPLTKKQKEEMSKLIIKGINGGNE